MKTTAVCLAAALLLVAGTSGAAGLKEGQWEYTNTMKIPGMPQMPALPPGVKLPPGMNIGGGPGGMSMSFKHCVTQEKLIPPTQDEGKFKCEITKQKQDGKRFEWAQRCTGKNTDFTSEGSGQYDGETMAAKMSSKGTMDGHPADMTMDISGRYLGPCPSK